MMKNEKKIGIFCSYVPEEIIIAAGFAPVRLKRHVTELREVNSYIFSNVCPYLKNIFESGLTHKLDTLDGIIFTNSCDGMRKIYDLWNQYIQTPFMFMLEIPKNRNASSVDYFTDQLHVLKKSIEDRYDVDISQQLPSAIALMDTHRSLMGKIFDGQKETPPRLRGSDLFALCEQEMTSPKIKTTPELKKAADLQTASSNPNGNKPRILLMGNTFGNDTLFNMVESADGSVVVFDTCEGLKHYTDLVEDGPDPIERLARRYLLKPPCPRMPGFDVRTENLEHIINDYAIDGVIYSNLKHCDYSLFEIPQVERFLKNRNTPFLALENDYVWSDVERLRTRVEAFLEVIA